MKKRVFVYPCGTEIGLEIYKSVHNSIHFDLFGGSSTYDHGQFVYKKHIQGLPFIDESSKKEDIENFASIIRQYGFDYIYPAMDAVIVKFAEFAACFESQVIVCPLETVRKTRSKKETYKLLSGIINVPMLFDNNDKDMLFPVFIKPDKGQGSYGARVIRTERELEFYLKQQNGEDLLILEYLPGDEYTVDCFTNSSGELVYVGGRSRRRVKGGISVNAVRVESEEYLKIAELINTCLEFRGGWFFQLKRNKRNELTLLEVAPRIAGGSALTRNYGVNLPLMTLHLFSGSNISSVLFNNYNLELDRALQNVYRSDIIFDHVYIDYDDTLLIKDKLNIELIAFLYQCVNSNIPITLLTRKDESLWKSLKDFRLESLFNEIVCLSNTEKKSDFIMGSRAIFIDDSYGEREEVKKSRDIYVFDTHMIESLRFSAVFDNGNFGKNS